MEKMYVHRKSGKTGEFVRHDTDKHCVYLRNDSGEFSVSESQFKSFWRELHIDEDVVAPEIEITNNVANGSGDKRLTSDELKAYICSKRNARFEETDNELSVYVDDVLVLRLVGSDSKHTCVAYMLPDVYTCSSLPAYKLSDMRVDDTDPNKLTVVIAVDESPYDILTMVADAIIDINLYGYME